VRRVCFDRVGVFDESLQANEDWDMWLRVAKHYRFAYVNRVVAQFRRHGGNLTSPLSRYFADTLNGRVKILDKAFSSADLLPVIVAMKPIAYRNMYIGIGFRWLHAREFRKAGRFFWRAMCVGGNPAVTLAHVIWFLLTWGFFSRFTWGRRFVKEIADLRRRWRNQRSLDSRREIPDELVERL